MLVERWPLWRQQHGCGDIRSDGPISTLKLLLPTTTTTTTMLLLRILSSKTNQLFLSLSFSLSRLLHFKFCRCLKLNVRSSSSTNFASNQANCSNVYHPHAYSRARKLSLLFLSFYYIILCDSLLFQCFYVAYLLMGLHSNSLIPLYWLPFSTLQHYMYTNESEL